MLHWVLLLLIPTIFHSSRFLNFLFFPFYFSLYQFPFHSLTWLHKHGGHSCISFWCSLLRIKRDIRPQPTSIQPIDAVHVPQTLSTVHLSLTFKPHQLHCGLLVTFSNVQTLTEISHPTCFDFWTCVHPTVAPGICSDFSFKCLNKECVNKVNAECDRVSDCSDGSDESGCGKKCSDFYTF